MHRQAQLNVEIKTSIIRERQRGFQRFRQPTSAVLASAAFGLVLLTSAMAGRTQDASQKRPSTPSPRIKFNEEAYDFGTTPQGVAVTHIFKFKNVGAAPLKITRVRSSCGCMAAQTTAETIQPGGEGGIKVTLNTGRYVGNMMRTVYVHSNDHANPVKKLTVKANVECLVFLTPSRIYINKRMKEESITKKVTIVWKTEERFDVSSVTSSSKHITAEILKVEKAPQPSVVFEVTVGPGTPVGRLNEKVQVHTTSKRWPVIDVPVIGNIKGDITVSPGLFSFGQVQQGMNANRKARVTKAHEPNLRVEKVVSSLSFLQVEAKEVVKGKYYVIYANVSPDAPLGTFRGSVYIHTNSPDQPKITVPVFGMVRPKSGSQQTTR